MAKKKSAKLNQIRAKTDVQSRPQLVSSKPKAGYLTTGKKKNQNRVKFIVKIRCKICTLAAKRTRNK